MSDMGKTPGLTRRGNVFYFRKRVPESIRKLVESDYQAWQQLVVNLGSQMSELQSIAPRKGVVRPFIEQSLGTGDKRRAEVEFHALAATLSNGHNRSGQRLVVSPQRPATQT